MAEANLGATGAVSSGQIAWDRAKERARLKRAPGTALQAVMAGDLPPDMHNAAILAAGGALASDIDNPIDLSVPPATPVAKKASQPKRQKRPAPVDSIPEMTCINAAIKAEGWGMSLPVLSCDRQDDTVVLVLPRGHSFNPAAGTNMQIECPGRFVGNVFYPGTHANISALGSEVIMMLATD